MRIVLADDAALLREGLAGLLTTAGHDVVAQVADADDLRRVVEELAGSGGLPDVVVTDVRMPPTGTDDGLRAAVDLRAAHVGLPVIVLSAYVAGPYLRDLLDGSGPTAGGVGYLLKERVGRVSDFLHSLELVAAGGVVVDPEVLARLVRGTGLSERADERTEPPAQPEQPAQRALADQPVQPAQAAQASGERLGDHPAGRRAAGGSSGGGAAGAPTDSPAAPDSRGCAAGASARLLHRLSPREEEVLALMAEGLSNARIAERLVLSDGAVAKHVANILTKLDLPPQEENRRVRAVLTFLRARA